MTSNPPGRSARSPALLVGALLCAFAVLSYSAARTKCPTADEPVHLTASYLCRFLDDFRCNPDKPILWKYWAAIFLGPEDVRIDTTKGIVPDPRNNRVLTLWTAMLNSGHAQYDFAHQTLFADGHADTERAFAAG